MGQRHFYLVAAAIIGTLVPWWFFGSFFATEGLNVGGFAAALIINGAAGGFTADVLISLAIFWIWSWHDARERGVGRWWLALPASACLGLSLAMPLYFYLRASKEALA